MVPKNIQFGGGAAASVFSPIALAIVLIAGVLICVLPRKKAVVPFLFAGMLIPINQVWVVAGLHFPMFRVLALFGFARMARAKISGKDKIFSGGMNKIDWAVIILTVFTAVDGALLWQSSAEITFQMGNAFTVFGLYFLVRYLLQTEEDVKGALRAMSLVLIILAPTIIYEHNTGNNVYYGLLGGLHAAKLEHSAVRDGFLRAQGPFGHAILAGTFAGFMMPLFVGWWSKDKGKLDRTWAVLGLIAASIIPFMVGSSTALFALLAGVGALCLWPMRRHLRLARWGIVGTLIAGQLYMTAPVWHIISDVSLSDGSSSYHRYMLVDQCIRHFWVWALVGTKDYASWGWDMWDLCNQYVATADPSGLVPLIALITILVVGFKYIGKARKHYEGDRQNEFFVWAIGCSFFANVIAFFGVSYWDQTIIGWYLVLAIVAAVTLPARITQAARADAPIEAFIQRPSLSIAAPPSAGSGIAQPVHLQKDNRDYTYQRRELRGDVGRRPSRY